MTTPSPETLTQLARFDSPTICNVVELFNHRPRCSGHLAAAIRAIYPALPPMVGYAVTATFRSAAPASPGEAVLNLFEQKAVFDAVVGPKVMVVQDLDEPHVGAVYGEIVARLCQAYGCVGLVTNGYARDILQVEALDFPCFASGISVSHAHCRVLSMGDTVNVGGVTVRPGDLLHGDANGVTTIPTAIASQVADGCQAFVEAEEVLIRAAESGALARGEYEPAFAEFRARRDALAARLSGGGADGGVGV